MAYHSTRTHSFVFATPNNSKRQLASQITMSDCTNVHQPVWPTFGRCSRIKIMALIRSSVLVARSSLISTIFGSESPGGSYRIFLSLVWWERERGRWSRARVGVVVLRHPRPDRVRPEKGGARTAGPSMHRENPAAQGERGSQRCAKLRTLPE